MLREEDDKIALLPRRTVIPDFGATKNGRIALMPQSYSAPVLKTEI